MNPNTGHLVRDTNTITSKEDYKKLTGRNIELANIFLDGRHEGNVRKEGFKPLIKVADEMTKRDLEKKVAEMTSTKNGKERLSQLLEANFPLQSIYEKMNKEGY